ncbi:hypothetical protein [Candidatus Nitrosocosmicus franklandus]|uniref:Uncharacterized protein n=1 Tax=Candidatus Nitrosocosmicus franklandianus TaxID=1798806 RepID=A0A484I5S0_9ARCH|nr:hypothetical protein [Candidatus Nitrosocosmicus franklandus]VFJ13069.1 conserved protein of unknown function [Candidatus Nitrosocosmicus franklandus]
MLGYTDDDIKNAAEIREWLTKQIMEKQEEIDKIKITLSLIDSVLKKGSFKTAANLNVTKSDLTQDKKYGSQLDSKPYKRTVTKPPDETRQKDIGESKAVEIKPIKRLKDNTLVAQVHIFPNSVEITPEENIKISLETPPFRSFFLNRILQGMKNKDLEKLKQGSLSETEVINFEVITDEPDNKNIKKVVINNYRDKERINEIFNTAAWVITRMLEKGER